MKPAVHTNRAFVLGPDDQPECGNGPVTHDGPARHPNRIEVSPVGDIAANLLQHLRHGGRQCSNQPRHDALRSLVCGMPNRHERPDHARCNRRSACAARTIRSAAPIRKERRVRGDLSRRRRYLSPGRLPRSRASRILQGGSAHSLVPRCVAPDSPAVGGRSRNGSRRATR